MNSNPAPIPEEQAREAINRWAAAGFYRLRNMGDKIFINQISPTWAYTVRLRTHSEERNLSHAQVPYHGGPVDDRGRPPNPWDIQVSRPGDFKESSETIPVPHTERVKDCDRCGSRGSIMCSFCHGSGRTNCMFCTGTGVRREHVSEGTTTRLVERPCSSCMGGKVTCMHCSGNGRRTCSECDGSGQVKTFEQLEVRFVDKKRLEICDESPVPDDWFSRLSGEILADEQAPRLDRVPPVNDEVDGRTRKLLDRSHDIDEGNTRILMQALKIERVPLQEVSYTYAGKELKLWLCGNENEVHAPDAPWNRGRLFWTIFLIVGGVVLAVGLLVLLLSIL